MEINDESKVWTLNFLKHDWFQQGNDGISVHLYVKDIIYCNIDFQDDCTSIYFKTSNEQFLKVHGPKTEGKQDVLFLYSLNTSGKMLPEKCTYSVSKTRIELQIVKAIPNRWISLETQKAVTDRKKASDIKKESSSAVNTTSESSQISYDSNQAPSANGTSSEKLDPGEVPLKEQQNESVSLEEEKGRLFPRPSRSSENMMLLGGKSTPVSKKSNDSESKVEKETVVSTEPQAAAIARDGSSLRNVNKAISAGLTGLENYANNCYMNVVIQVLANLPEIRDYFIDDHFLNFLSTNNPLSSGGRVAKAFSDVLKALWSGRKRAVRPQDLKSIMGKRCSLFLGFQQCDAQEFFSTLLDNLHEDMNHGKRPDKCNESAHKDDDCPSVSEKPDTAWNDHFKRHNSLIIKMFHGQMVSKLTCQACHKSSTTYEACAQISLPITMSKLRLHVTVFFRDHSRQPERLCLQISSTHAQIWHLLNVLERHIGIAAHCLRVCHDNKGSFIPAFDDDAPLTSIRNTKQVIVCEIKDEKEADFVSIPFRQHVSNPSKLNKCATCGKSQIDMETRLKRCTRCLYLAYCSRDCQIKHWPSHQRDCRKGLKASIGLPFYVTMRRHKLSFEALMTAAMHYSNFSVGFSEKESDSSEGESEEKKSVKQEMAANVAPKQSEKFSRSSSVPDGDQDEKKHGFRVEGALNTSSKSVDNTVKSRESDKDEKHRQMRVEGASKLSSNSVDDFVLRAYLKPDQDPILLNFDDLKVDMVTSAEFLAIEWQNDCIREKEGKELNAPFKMVQGCLSDDEPMAGDRCNIEDCFSLFLEPEKLNEKDGWKCPKCKTVQAVKKEMAISYPPPILLVHFKRFTYATYSQKVTKGINYPICGLDLSHFIEEETKSLLSNQPIYDLTGVICHKGSMGIGHYTCMVRCLNQQGLPDIGWRYFDDDNVLKIEDERVVDSSAYVLVYRMRSTAQALKLESPFVISPVQANEVKQERSRARTPSRQISAESDSNAGSKPLLYDSGIAKGTLKQTDRRSETDSQCLGCSSASNDSSEQENNAFSCEQSKYGPCCEEFSEESFELANDDESIFVKLSEKRECEAEKGKQTETLREGEPGKTSPLSDSKIVENKNEKPDGRTSFAGTNTERKATEELFVEDGFTSIGNNENNDSDLSFNPSSKEKVTEKSLLTNGIEENEDEQFYLALNEMRTFDLTEVTENDLD